MPLAAPQLDDRHFQDLVDESKKRIPQFCKEWTDHNVSDPGVTLIELFAWMTDVMLYRLNQVPDRHYIKFLEMLGITLREPIPACVPVTFWLSAPQATPVIIPAGTEVASTQTETERPIVFTTDEDFRVEPPVLTSVLSRVTSSGKKAFREQNLRRLESGFEGFEAYTTSPQVDDALYFGFENDLSCYILGFDFDFDPAGGAGIDPSLPPYIWEASTGDPGARWSPCQVDSDTTRGMNGGGAVRLHLPKLGKYAVGGKNLYWVRARVKEITPQEQQDGMRPYQVTPRLRRLAYASWGGTTPATHAQQVDREFCGRSDGTPGQRFNLQLTPILSRKPGETLLVESEGEPPQRWTEVNDFADSGAENRHFTLDSTTGELRLGPAIRQRDGTIKLYGAIPSRGANIIFARYRYGGGQEGNVQTGVLNTLKTSIPYIARVSNRVPAWGGLDAESLDEAKMRAPALLRSRQRAVTETDYEFLARQILPASIGRVKCLQPRPDEAGKIIPGQIYLLVIPRVPNPSGYIEAERLRLHDEDIQTLATQLDERRLLTVRLDIRPPAFVWVAVKVKLRGVPGVAQASIEAEVLARLYRYLNPLNGGDGQGWQFGRNLFVSDIYQCLQGIPNVQFIRGLELYAAKPGGEATGLPIEIQEVVAHGVIASGLHSVEFV